MSALQPLEELTAGMKLLVGGQHLVTVSDELAERFEAGDSLGVVEGSGELLHIPAAERRVAQSAVDRAANAFGQMSRVSDAQISKFYQAFADRLLDDAVWSKITAANERDVRDAKARGRSTTRLEATAKLRASMIEGLQGWLNAPSLRGRVHGTDGRVGWVAQLIAAELGVVGFVFEGRPNVVADATGVLRGGNTVVFRIGRDALATAQAMLESAVEPALREAELPEGAVVVVPSASHAAGWALFSDPRLSLAVARGSGPAVDTLGSLARRAGVPVSLHGTGGAWLCAGAEADPEAFEQAVAGSLDRKVCNTLNTCCIPKAGASQLVGSFLRGLERAAQRRNHPFKLHVAKGSEPFVPQELFSRRVAVGRAQGSIEESQAELIDEALLGQEWEWEDSPEVTLKIVDDTAHAVELFNRYSPRFVACLVSSDAAEHEQFYREVHAPFVGDGFTRWVDGQYALRRPELGLSNWQHGRLFGRGGILSGDGVFTVRTRVRTLR